MKFARVALLSAASVLLFNIACSSSDDSSSNSNADAGPAGGPVSGPQDDHCSGVPHVTVDPATCATGDTGDTGAGGAADSGASGSAGAPTDCNQTHDAEYGDTLYNSEGDDDDCKYHASWTSTPIRVNTDVTFTLTTSLIDDPSTPLAPLTDGKTPLSALDVYEPCDPTHRTPTQNLMPKIAQTSPGVFSAGPIKFDQSGRWVVRFHLYEQCIDGDVSPHGHIAFFVDVP
ncbi:MAG TPA: hypothetical protein VGM44_15775 [Polyangiaceae bacterium]|jgi:hypothetical protein